MKNNLSLFDRFAEVVTQHVQIRKMIGIYFELPSPRTQEFRNNQIAHTVLRAERAGGRDWLNGILTDVVDIMFFIVSIRRVITCREKPLEQKGRDDQYVHWTSMQKIWVKDYPRLTLPA